MNEAYKKRKGISSKIINYLHQPQVLSFEAKKQLSWFLVFRPYSQKSLHGNRYVLSGRGKEWEIPLTSNVIQD